MTIPKDVFGRCPVCGENGADNSAPNSAGGTMYAEDNLDTTGNGVRLIDYQGTYMCQLCAKRLEADSEQEVISAQNRAQEDFLSKAGFKNKMDE